MAGQIGRAFLNFLRRGEEFNDDVGRQARGLLDAAGTVGASYARDIPAGINGLLKLATTLDSDAAADEVERSRAALPVEPMTEEGGEHLARLGRGINSAAGWTLQNVPGARAAADYAYQTTAAAPLSSAVLAGLLNVDNPLRAAETQAVKQAAKAGARAAKAAPKQVVLNIGHKIGDEVKLDAAAVNAALEKRGVKVRAHEVREPDPSNPYDERTSVVQINRPLTPEEAHDVSDELGQMAIAQRVDGEGDLHGPGKMEWDGGKFNPEFFKEPKPIRAGLLKKMESDPDVRSMYENLIEDLTPEESARLTPLGVKGLRALQKGYDSGEISQVEDLAEMASRGDVKRGWYQHSAEAIADVFGDDAPRFVALLASMSPQTSVESNLTNALNVWKNWTKAGRPTDPNEIKAVMGRSVQGNKGEDSILDAWINNSVLSLTAPDARAIQLSGPKVHSFAGNLRGLVNEVTNDAWMAKAMNVSQELFEGASLKDLDALTLSGKRAGGKGIGYLFTNAQTRKAAKLLSEKTGVKWTPDQVQETVWSWVKTVMEKRAEKGEARTIRELADAVTNEEIAGTPDFAGLLNAGGYREILEEAGYGPKLGLLASKRKAEISPAAPLRLGRIDRLAERLERQYQSGSEQAVTTRGDLLAAMQKKPKRKRAPRK